jgi:hypothetical protein
MDDTNNGLLKSIDRLVETLAKRVAFWPPVEDDKTETSKLSFAHMLTEKYVEMLGLTRVSDIALTSSTEQDMLDTLEEELTLRDTKEQENVLEDKKNIIVHRHGRLSRGK